MSSIQQPSPRGRRFSIVWLIIGFAIFNFVAQIITESAGPSYAWVPLTGILIGSMAGQCCLLAIWGVLGPFRVPARLIITLTIGLFLTASLSVGDRIGDPPSITLDQIVATFLFLPLILRASAHYRVSWQDRRLARSGGIRYDILCAVLSFQARRINYGEPYSNQCTGCDAAF